MRNNYRCVICGYIYIGNEPPEICPICGASSIEFELQEALKLDEKESPNFWRCVNCEYIHKGSDVLEVCPVCGAKKDSFEPYFKEENNKKDTGNVKILILGGGIAGISAAEEIRRNSEKAYITIVSAEKHLPYYRLNLSRYLAKEVNRENLNIYPESWYKENGINLIQGKEAIEINTDKNKVKLEDDRELSYDKLIIAMGAHAFLPPIPGNNLKNVVTVRKIENVEQILGEMNKIESCVCIGGGILGLEVAGAIAKNGVKVTLLEGSDWLMPRQLNKKAAIILTKYLKNIGVEVKENAKVKEIIGENSCQGVALSSGEVLKSKIVIITTGVRTNTYLVRKAGLEVDKGLIVNNYMETSNKNIYGAGDVTEYNGTLYGLWNVAQFQGKVAAQNAIGNETQFGGIPRSNVLKVLGLDMFSIGEFNPKDGSYYQYEQEGSDKYFNFVLRDGKMVGSIIIGDKALIIKVKQAVEKGMNFPHELYDDVESIIKNL